MMDGEGDGGGVLRKKVVLLGPQSTGKSTFFRALGYLYGCVEGAQNRYGTMHSDGSVLKLRASVVNLFVSLNIQKPGLLPPDILECLGSLDTSTFSKLYDLLKNDPAVKSILTNYHELGLHLTPLASFVSSSDLLWRLSQHSPLTTIWEVLSSGIPSTGIHTWEMDIEGSGVLVLDVGGTPPQRKKWIHCYDDVSAVLFFVSLTSYDELTADSLPQLDDAASLLASVSKSEPLREKPIFLLLSMLDQFKLKRISVPVNLDWPPAEFSLCYSMPSAVRATIVYPPQPGVLCTSELSSAFPLWSEIFEWLDMFDLCKMRLVCRTWKNVSDQHRRGWRRHCEALCMKPINTRSLAERHSAYSALVQTECEEKIACIVVFHWQPDVKRILWALTRNLECNQLQRVHPILLNNTNLSDVGMATGLVCDRCQFLDRVNSMSGKTINWDSIADNYYDILADKVSAIDLPFWKRMAREACTSCGNNQILEVMAGTGRVSIPLAIDGAAAHRVVVAVDYCNSMLRKLREKATNVSPRGIIETVYQDARKLDLGERKFGLVFIALNSISEILEMSSRTMTVTALARHLAPHGTLILTLHNPTVKRESYKNISQSGTEPKDPELAARGLRLIHTSGSIEVYSKGELSECSRIATGEQYYVDCARGCSVSLPIKFELVEKQELIDTAEECGLELTKTLGGYNDEEYNPTTSPFIVLCFTKPGPTDL